MKHTTGFRDVRDYPPGFLKLRLDGVSVPVTYQREWQDGFAARGWKLDAAIGDPAIIASTRESGGRIPTSVLVHDLLDHLLSGFDVSGHRAEAMALIQLNRRTGSDIRRDYLQLVNEDLRVGRVNAESLHSFLPEDLRVMIPRESAGEGRKSVAELQRLLGPELLVERLVERFYELGEQGRYHAQDSWRLLGLQQEDSRQIGLALQQVLERADREVERAGVEALTAVFLVSEEECVLEINNADSVGLEKRYAARVQYC